MTPFKITWEAPEFEFYEKEISWYWLSIIIAALMIAFSIWERDFLFGFFVVVAEILLLVWGNRQPRIFTFILSETDFSIGNEKHYAIREFDAWSVGPDIHGFTEVIWNFKSRVKLPLKTLVPSETVQDIREHVKTFLRETEYQLSFLDAIEKLLRF